MSVLSDDNHFPVGWLTFGYVLPQGAATNYINVDGVNTQTDVKVLWPDGSIRHALVTAKITSEDDYDLTTGVVASGSPFTPTWPTVTVVFVISGITYTATLGSFSSSNAWLNGPLVREYRKVVTPVTGGSVAQAVLQVVFDIRCYEDGAQRVDVMVQNVQDIAAGNSVIYDVTINIGGSPVFTQAAYSHGYLTKWRRTFLVGGLVESVPVLDFQPFFDANAIPNWLGTITNEDGVSFNDGIGQYGVMNPNMAETGGRPELGPYPDWCARYIVHRTAGQFAFMIKQANQSGSWSNHITEADGQTIISLDTYPNYWMDGRASTDPIYSPRQGPMAVPRQGFGFLPGIVSGIEAAHMNSLNFIPYLVTGDRWHLDQQKLWGNFGLINASPGDVPSARAMPGDTSANKNAAGILVQHQVRGFGWVLRIIGDLAAYCPDADTTDKAYFTAKVQNNLNYLDTFAQNGNGGPFNVMFWEKYINAYPGLTTISTWQLCYLVFAVDRCRQHGFGPTAAVSTRISAFQNRLFNSDPEYPPLFGGPYYLAVGTDASLGVPVFDTTMGQILARNYGTPAANPQPFVGYYGPEARIVLQIAERLGLAGATSALAYLQPFIATDLTLRAGWAITDSGGADIDPVAPTIITQPQNVSISEGTTTTLSVIASGTGPFTYQWFAGSAAIPLATSPIYVTPVLTVTTVFHVVVTNSEGSATSSDATVTVTTPGAAPTITTQPIGAVVASGGSATMSVVVTGPLPTFQWFRGTASDTSTPVSGGNTPVLNVTNQTVTTSYWCRITTSGGSVDSQTATVTIAGSSIVLALALGGAVTATVSAVASNTEQGSALVAALFNIAKRYGSVTGKTIDFPTRRDS